MSLQTDCRRFATSTGMTLFPSGKARELRITGDFLATGSLESPLRLFPRQCHASAGENTSEWLICAVCDSYLSARAKRKPPCRAAFIQVLQT